MKNSLDCQAGSVCRRVHRQPCSTNRCSKRGRNNGAQPEQKSGKRPQHSGAARCSRTAKQNLVTVRWGRLRTPAYPIRLQLTQIRTISLQDGRNGAEASRSSALFWTTLSSDHLSIVNRRRQTPGDGRSPLVAPCRRWKAPRSDQSWRAGGGAKAFRPAHPTA